MVQNNIVLNCAYIRELKKHDISPNHIRQLVHGAQINYIEPAIEITIIRQQSRNDMINFLIGQLSKGKNENLTSHITVKFLNEAPAPLRPEGKH